eukprot:TRINITY_DN40763_c0_g1_i1.p1 TRINITY_DN40763_c0_g1~~TRINITY_DN40763_c0_g1_i1.p1  ORF type:complete len:814 (-),score=81.86 TRINITY_DN40763_c0_g1_i1:13-2454(-)
MVAQMPATELAGARARFAGFAFFFTLFGAIQLLGGYFRIHPDSGAMLAANSAATRANVALLRHHKAKIAFASIITDDTQADGGLVLGRSLGIHCSCVQSGECERILVVLPAVHPLSQERLQRVGWRLLRWPSPPLGLDAREAVIMQLLGLTEYATLVLLTPTLFCVHDASTAFSAGTAAAPGFDTPVLVLRPSLDAHRSAWNSLNSTGVALPPRGAVAVFVPQRHQRPVQQAFPRKERWFVQFDSPPWRRLQTADDFKRSEIRSVGSAFFAEWWWVLEELHRTLFSRVIEEEGRITLLSNTANSYTVELKDHKNWTLDGLNVLLAPEGLACTESCRLVGHECVTRGFRMTPFLDCVSCAAISRSRNCSALTGDPAFPAFDVNADVCYVSHQYYPPGIADCYTSPPPKFRRLCPCALAPTARTAVYSARIPFTGWASDQILKLDSEEAAGSQQAFKAPRIRAAAGDFCDGSNPVFGFASDSSCIRFLSERSHIRSIRPMVAIMAFARTVKFKVRFDQPNLKAILKVPQDKFPFEPFSECLAYWVDRIIGLNRVPPTAWVSVPIAWLRKAVKDHADPERAAELEHTFFNYYLVKKRVGSNPNVTAELEVSLQLWIDDLHPLQDTVWSVPHDWWMLFRVGKPLPSRLSAEKLKALPLVSDQVVYDYILGNPDRRPGKNNYVVGGCRRGCGSGGRQNVTASTPVHMVHVDQGSSFYVHGGPDGNPLTATERGNSSFCRFSNTMIQNLRKLASTKSPYRTGSGPTLFSELKRLVPPSVIETIKEGRVWYAQERLDAVLAHVYRRCMSLGAPADVLHWP